jgi:hypothetical protein
MTATATDVVVSLDLHPADALIADTGCTFRAARVTVADGTVQVWRLESAGPVVVFTSPLLAWSGSVRTGYTLSTEAGPVVADRGGGGCCGARLGTVDLYPGRRRVNTALT